MLELMDGVVDEYYKKLVSYSINGEVSYWVALEIGRDMGLDAKTVRKILFLLHASGLWEWTSDWKIKILKR